MPKRAKTLKIGFVFDDSLDSSDGVSQYVKTLGKWLSSQGHEVRYLVGETKLKNWAGGRVYSMSRNQRVVFNGNRLSIPLPSRKSFIKTVLENENFDVLHVQVPHSPFMAQKVINSTKSSTAIFGTFHIMPSGRLADFGSRLLRLSYGRGLRKFDHFYSVSQPAADFAQKVFGIKSVVLPNVVELDRFAATNTKTTKKADVPARIVFLGRLVERKGSEQLLKAFYESRCNAELVVAGDGPLRSKLERYVEDKGLESKVKFLGFIDETDKPGLLASADIACFPSLFGESFGIVLIEAMAAGAGIVIGGNNPGYASVLSGKPELLFDPFNTSEFAAKINQFLNNLELRRELHDWQSQHVRQYDVKKIGKKLVGDYLSVIAKLENNSHN
jgi:phosphatidylinositol alpha-mannosyltransferase